MIKRTSRGRFPFVGGSKHYELAAFATIALVIFTLMSWNAWRYDAELTTQYVELEELRRHIGVNQRAPAGPTIAPEISNEAVTKPLVAASRKKDPIVAGLNTSDFSSYNPTEGTIVGSGIIRNLATNQTRESYSSEGGQNAEAASHPMIAAPRFGQIDLNTATLEELQTLPGIGEVRAGDIIKERQRRGGFNAPSDLLEVPGIGPKTLKAVEEEIYIGDAPPAASSAAITRPPAGYVPASALTAPNPTPSDAYVEGRLNLNRATREQLQMLPGIGPKRAADILAYRYSRGGFKRPEELMEVKGIGMKIYRDLAPHIIVR